MFLLKKMYEKLHKESFISFDVFYNNICSEFAVICAHDVLGNSMDMQFIMRKLVDEFELITVDFCGHAGSDNLKEYSYENYMQDCMTLINQAKSKKIIWIGQGVGAILGAKLASYHNSPIAGLIAFDFSKLQEKVNCVDTEYEYEILDDAKGTLYDKYDSIPRSIIDEFFLLYKYKVMNSMFVNNYHLDAVSQIDNFFGIDLNDIFNKVKCDTLLIDKKADHFNNKDTHTDNVKLLYQDDHIKLIYDWIKKLETNYNPIKQKVDLI